MKERTRLWALRLLALTIAVALWFFFAYQKRERESERVVLAAVTYDTPRGVMVLNPVSQVAVRLRGGARRIGAINPSLVNVQVQLPRDYTGTFEATLDPGDVFTPEGLTVVSIEPSSIRLTLDAVIVRELPVRVELMGEPAAGATTLGPPIAIPGTARVTGPASRVAGLRFLYTRLVSLDGHAQTFEEPAPLLPPDPLTSVDPSIVRARVMLEPPRLSTEVDEHGRRETP